MTKHLLVLFVLLSLVWGVAAHAIIVPAGYGKITFCFINQVDGQIATQNLPVGTFTLTLRYHATDTEPFVPVDTIKFSTADFVPNKSLVSAQPDMQCITRDNLYFGYYNYSYKSDDGKNAVFVNDQYDQQAKTSSDFYLYSPQTNKNADGYIVLGKGRTDRTLVLLNSFTTVVAPVNTNGGGGGGGSFSSISGGGYSVTLTSAGTSTASSTASTTATTTMPIVATSSVQYVCSPASMLYMPLRAGSRGSAVQKLQHFLNLNQGANLPLTGYFGPMTMAAVKKFQVDHADKVLTPIGLTMPTGNVGPMTMKAMNDIMCGR